MSVINGHVLFKRPNILLALNTMREMCESLAVREELVRKEINHFKQIAKNKNQSINLKEIFEEKPFNMEKGKKRNEKKAWGNKYNHTNR